MPVATAERVTTWLHTGRTVAWIVTASGWPRRNVLAAAARDRLLINPETDCAMNPRQRDEPVGEPEDIEMTTQPTPAAPPSPTTHTCVQSVDALLAGASRSSRAKTRAAGEKLRAALDDLKGLVEAEVEETRARQRQEAEEAQARADIARLEEQLADARAKVGKPPRPVRDYDPKVVRAWARENGVEVAAIGLIKQSVVDQWRASSQAGAE
jgi:hypothetical protein